MTTGSAGFHGRVANNVAVLPITLLYEHSLLLTELAALRIQLAAAVVPAVPPSMVGYRTTHQPCGYCWPGPMEAATMWPTLALHVSTKLRAIKMLPPPTTRWADPPATAGEERLVLVLVGLGRASDALGQLLYLLPCHFQVACSL